MKPHIIDHNRIETPGRAAQFVALERAAHPSKATLALQSRRPAPAEGARVANYLRIARGETG